MSNNFLNVNLCFCTQIARRRNKSEIEWTSKYTFIRPNLQGLARAVKGREKFTNIK